MVKRAVLGIVLAACSSTVMALPFTMQTDTLEKQTFEPGLINFQNTVVNTSEAALKLTVSREVLQMPEGWQSMLCVGITCYPPTRDAVTIESLAPGETLHVALDVLPNATQGSAQVKLIVALAADPQQLAEASFTTWLGPKSAVRPIAGRNASGAGLLAAHARGETVSLTYEITTATAPVHLAVYSLQGEAVANLTNGYLVPGRYSQIWNRRNDAGEPVATGAYTVLLRAGHRMAQTARITVR